MKTRIVELECSLLSKEVRSSRNLLDSLIADNFMEIGPTGMRFGKNEVLEWLPKELNVRYFPSHFELRELASDLAQLLYKIVCYREGREPSYSQRCSIWKLQNTNWMMIYHQGTTCGPFDHNI